MGMYLDCTVVYGVAWKADDAPWGTEPCADCDGDPQPVEAREPVYGGRLVWGYHGMQMGEPDVHLAVCEAPSGEPQGRFAQRVRWEEPDADEVVRWDAWIIDYLTAQGVPVDRIPAPGWLALASFG